MANYKKEKVKKEQVLFYLSFTLIPIILFVIFYIVVNVNSILMAFQEYDFYGGKFIFNGFSNFKDFFNEFTETGVMKKAFGNSFKLYLVTLCVGLPLALMFSFYIYKKQAGAAFFRVCLYLPQVLSTIALVTIYKYCVDAALPKLLETITGKSHEGLLVNLDTQFGTIMFLAFYLSFGSNVLIYTSTMSGISDSIVESAQLEGVNKFQEMVLITLPLIFPTITNFILMGIATIFTDQMLLYNFYAGNAEVRLFTVGYYMYKETQKGDLSLYPLLSAMGLCFTVVLTAVTFTVKHLMNKYGPSCD